ncbi:hypothetical protein [Streptomyces sp. NBC_00525]|uniref:hypothetical protein n=1 Tax=Streptomyces sp. NBC_00525 TaxID=2903660 RepID=UPI002E7FD4E9|nr:hypothetical protein [Streptomyces sp. NBC_00525]WUC97880.1 hypothetical protein OG710_29830 [Streptomyces sp. NBC_00525]
MKKPLNLACPHVYSNRIAFSPDSRKPDATTDDGVGTLWNLDVESAVRRICEASSGALGREQWRRYVTELPYTPPCAATS